MIIIVFFIVLFQLIIAIGIRCQHDKIFRCLTKLRRAFYFMYVVFDTMLWTYPALRELRLDPQAYNSIYFLVHHLLEWA